MKLGVLKDIGNSFKISALIDLICFLYALLRSLAFVSKYAFVFFLYKNDVL